MCKLQCCLNVSIHNYFSRFYCIQYGKRSNNKYLCNVNFLSHPSYTTPFLQKLFCKRLNSSNTYDKLEKIMIPRNIVTDKNKSNCYYV